MKKIMIVFFTLFLTASLSPYALTKGLGSGCYLNYYSVADSIYKDVYGSGNLMFGGYLSYEVIRKLELRVEANYFQDKGKMTLSQEEITFTLIPLVFGVRFRVIKRNLCPYLGVGVGVYSYREMLPDRFEDVSDSTIGYHVEGGSYLNLTRRFYLDMNVRYILANAKPFEETIKLGGFRAGIGIGYWF